MEWEEEVQGESGSWRSRQVAQTQPLEKESNKSETLLQDYSAYSIKARDREFI